MSKDSNPTTQTKIKPETTLILTAGGRGGSAKTTSLALIADWLVTKGRSFSVVDCDLENAGTPSAFGNWFGGKANQLDLRDPEACDALLRQSSQSGTEFVLCDLPANRSGDLIDWRYPGHSLEDGMDRIDPDALDAVGETVLELIRELRAS